MSKVKSKKQHQSQQHQPASLRNEASTIKTNLQQFTHDTVQSRSESRVANEHEDTSSHHICKHPSKVQSNSEAKNGFVCSGCAKVIKRDKFLLKACQRYWHESCLKCDRCQGKLGELGNTLFCRSNMHLCRQDYLDLFGNSGICSVCDKLIHAYEMVMRAKSNVYHLECFACQLCNLRFCVGERFYLCQNKIVCQYDFEEHMDQMILDEHSNQVSIDRHTAQLVDQICLQDMSSQGNQNKHHLCNMDQQEQQNEQLVNKQNIDEHQLSSRLNSCIDMSQMSISQLQVDLNPCLDVPDSFNLIDYHKQ